MESFRDENEMTFWTGSQQMKMRKWKHNHFEIKNEGSEMKMDSFPQNHFLENGNGTTCWKIILLQMEMTLINFLIPTQLFSLVVAQPKRYSLMKGVVFLL